MCMQDIAIGQRTIIKRTQWTASGADERILGGNARRIGLTVTNATGDVTLRDTGLDSDGNHPVLCQFNAALGPHENVASIETYGQIILGDVWLRGTANGVYTVVEMLADDLLDNAVQKVVM